MAEFLNQKKPKRSRGSDGFNAMGKPVPNARKIQADDHLRQMGVTNAEDRFACISETAGHLERDRPYEALGSAMKYVDLTGAYRLMAALLTGAER